MLSDGPARQDNEGDHITVRTEADLEEMLRTTRRDASGLVRLHATRPRSDNLVEAARPHIRVARRYAASAADLVAKEAKKVAEEAIVLGVRGVSFVEDQWQRCSFGSDAPNDAAAVPLVAAADAEVAYAEPPRSNEDWINLPRSNTPPAAAAAAATPEQTPPLSYPMEQRLNELSSMGFCDRERNRGLVTLCRAHVVYRVLIVRAQLMQHNLDVAAVVAALLDA